MTRMFVLEKSQGLSGGANTEVRCGTEFGQEETFDISMTIVDNPLCVQSDMVQYGRDSAQ